MTTELLLSPLIRAARACAWAAFLTIALLSVSAGAEVEAGALRQYVERPDQSFSFVKEQSHEVAGVRVHVLRLTSQEWRGMEWRHRLTVVLPSSVRHPESAVLLVTGGSNRNERPLNFSGREAALAAQVANQSGVAVAVLEHVPNQPLLGDLYEDDLIAYTFAQKMRTGEADWPLLFPMVKSATRAMDAVTAFLAEETGRGPEKFIVTGASKRGWTTWLTAAVDRRVKAIAPMVFDILNFEPQLDLQKASFAGYSHMIRAYEEQNLFTLLSTDAGMALGNSVDPFTYRHLLDMPKLILLGTNDPYWSVDAAGLYFGELPGPKHLFYAANTGHSLGVSIAPVLLRFVQQTLAGEEMPQLNWKRSSAANEFLVSWQEPDAEATLWTAHSPTRDFREANWTSKRLAGSGEVRAELTEPADGFTARYIEVRFPSSAGPFGLCTEIVVTPAGGE